MLLKSIRLENFRQFINEEILFSQDIEKNVTVIIGENGTGKTTFEQAFFWCLYGETDFKDKIMLNKKVASLLVPNDEAEVKVTLSLTHGGENYTIIRSERYKKTYNNQVKPSGNASLNIAMKQRDGQTTYIKPLHCDGEIKKILPKQLSKYFFFDGERIEKMSKDLVGGQKSAEFANAVKGLLGLNAISSAIAHLKVGKNSVIGTYEGKYNSKGDSTIGELTTKIQKYEEELDQAQKDLEEADLNVTRARSRKHELNEKLKTFAESEKLQKDREKKERSIRNTESSKTEILKSITQSFNESATSFFTLSLLDRVVDVLAEADVIDKDIPEMSASTINFLLDRKSCICGTHLDPGTVPFENVRKLLAYLPPESVGISVARYQDELCNKLNQNVDLVKSIEDKLAVISRLDDEIMELKDDIAGITLKLGGDDVTDQVRSISTEIQSCDKAISINSGRHDQLVGRMSILKENIEREDTKRSKLALLDDSNKQIGIYIAYAKAICLELSKTYSDSEAKIRIELEETINNIFKSIYNGGMSLTIDEKYNVTVYVDDFDSSVETSTAQSISVIFAFITGIIKMARDNQKSEDPDKQMLSSEPYPLVMDAPLSSFDKKRIASVCKALPATAEQVIIFIKDTDGDLAEEYMGAKVGKRYGIEKIDEFETQLFGR